MGILLAIVMGMIFLKTYVPRATPIFTSLQSLYRLCLRTRERGGEAIPGQGRQLHLRRLQHRLEPVEPAVGLEHKASYSAGRGR